MLPQLSILVAVVLALTMGMSIFFKVKVITVSGAEKYTAWDVRQASGIQEGDGLLTFGEPRACGRITAALPYVKTARIGIKLPDTVNIKIEEYDVVYAVKDQSESWWLITSEGQVVEKTDSATAGQYTKLVGFQLSLPTVGEKAEAAEAARPTEPEGDTGLTGPTVPVTVFARDRLETALKILGCLEENGVIGRVASVDVTDLNQMELWYGEQYQVKLGDTARLDYKIRCMASSIAQLGDYQAGELDVSFTIWPEEVGYTPFA